MVRASSLIKWGGVAAIASGLGILVFLESGNQMNVEPMTLKGADALFYCIAFSPDGSLIAGGQQDGTVEIWQTQSGAESLKIPGRKRAVYDFSASVFAMDFSADGKTLAWTGGNLVVTLLDLKRKKIIETLGEHNVPVIGLRFIGAGKSIATASGIKEGVVRIWDLQTKRARVLFDAKSSKHHDPEAAPSIGGFALSRDGRRLAIGLLAIVVMLDVATGKELATTRPFSQRGVTALAFSPDGKNLAGLGEEVRVWDAISGKAVATLAKGGEGRFPVAVAFSPDGKMLAIGLSAGERRSSYVEIWSMATERRIAKFACHEAPVTQVAWSPDGKTIATCSVDHTIRLWDAPSILKAALE